MTVTDIIDGIIQKKNLVGYTNQQLADASGIPKPTIDRILRHDTPNPSMQTVLDLAAAVGFTFSNHPEHTPAVPDESGIKDPMTKHLINVYEIRCRAYEERIKSNSAHYNMLLAEKNRWLKFSMGINIILIVFLVSVLVLDILHPDIGWVREQLTQHARFGIGDVVLRVRDWLSSI